MTPLAPPDEDGFPFVPLAIAAALAGAVIASSLTAHPYANPDSHAFEAVARSLLAGRGFAYQEPLLPGVTLFAYRAPVFPLFAVPLLALGGVPLVLAAQGALVGLTAAVLGRMAARLGGRPAGWVAFAFAMAWWPTWQLAGQFLSETLYTTLTVLAVAAALTVRAAGARAAAAAGALVAAAALTRSIGAAVALAIGLWLLRTRPRALAAYVLAGLLLWLPWPLRNAVRLHAFVPFTTNAAMNFYSGNSGVSPDGCWRDMAAHVERGELGFERAFAERARREVLARPPRFARALLRKAIGYVVPLTREAGTPLHRALLPVIVFGLLFAPPIRGPLLLPGLVWLVQAAVSILTVTNTRYRAPSDWVIVLAASLAMAGIAGRYGRRGLLWALAAAAACASTFVLQLRLG